MCTAVLSFMAFRGIAQSTTMGGRVPAFGIGTVTLSYGMGPGSNYHGDNYDAAFGFKGVAEWGL